MSPIRTACSGGEDAHAPDSQTTSATLGRIVRLGGQSFLSRSRQPRHVHRILACLAQCRTPAMGGHHYRCRQCGHQHQVPHSCGNRHCPQCQHREAEAWLQKQQQSLLPVPYFHLVFTLPHVLNALVQFNQSKLYRLLFTSVRDTLLRFGHNHLGGQIGFSAVLHTWSQTLLDHYHLHVVIPAGALQNGHWQPAQNSYLFPVRALSEVYRATFIAGLQQLFENNELALPEESLTQPDPFKRLLRQSARKKWTVYAKRPFAGPQQVLGYLARYTHRTAISNRRILAVEHDCVRFRWKDYADSSKSKIMELSLHEFLRRFCLHILPQGFVRIRHYGFLANNCRHEKINYIRSLIQNQSHHCLPTDPNQDNPDEPQETKPPTHCPHCGSHDLVRIAHTPRPKARRPTAPLHRNGARDPPQAPATS